MNTVMVTMSALMKRYNADEAQIINVYRDNMSSPAFDNNNFRREDVFSPVAVRFLDNVFGYKDIIPNGVNAEAQKWKEKADELAKEVAKYEDQLLKMQENVNKSAGAAVVEKYKIKVRTLEKNYDILKEQNGSSLKLKEKHIEELNETIKSLQEDCERNSRSLEQVILLERELNNTKVNCEKLRIDLESARSELSSINAENAMLKNVLISKNDELATIQGAISECAKNIISSFETLQSYSADEKETVFPVVLHEKSEQAAVTEDKAADKPNTPNKPDKDAAKAVETPPVLPDKVNKVKTAATEKNADKNTEKDVPVTDSDRAKTLMSWLSSKVGSFF